MAERENEYISMRTITKINGSMSMRSISIVSVFDAVAAAAAAAVSSFVRSF